ncbi:MAG: hypothetical protein HYZ75_14820 [Elusimicrobia bacterium]|nr:hypothetical protein [Elusimicrobiota bacterium]
MAISRPLLAGAVAACLAGCFSPVKDSASQDTVEASAYRRSLAGTTIEDWAPMAAMSARRLLEQYGAPDEVRPEFMVWRGKDRWQRITAWNIPEPYPQGDDIGFVEHAVEYPPLTPAQLVNLSAFDSRLMYYGLVQTLAARSDREEVNILRLNLADDVLAWRVTPEQARQRYGEILNLEAAGKSSPYMSKLRF